jgi:hypothetical protein
MEIIEKDYAHLKGWFDEDWYWVTASVAPLDENGEPVEEDREYCGGYESTILDSTEDNAKWRVEVIEDLIYQVVHSVDQRLHKGQLRLDLQAA